MTRRSSILTSTGHQIPVGAHAPFAEPMRLLCSFEASEVLCSVYSCRGPDKRRDISSGDC
jgi:hypothetical protein